MMNKAIFEIWVQLVLGFGSHNSSEVFNKFSSAEEFYNGKENIEEYKNFLTKKEILNLQSVPLSEAQNIYTECEKNNISIVSMWDKSYPEKLIDISNPPVVLYYSGRLPDTTKRTISIVGTRNATPDGYKISKVLAYALSNSGVTIISGGAVGIDTNAHLGSLIGGSEGYCILGCGIQYNYLEKNKCLRDTLSIRGGIISEYPPFYPPNRFTFPFRNRLISGLSDGVVIVEAGKKSGAMITANLALEQGKDVFAVPGSLFSEKSEGTNYLIQNGAFPVVTAKDILYYYDIEENSYSYEVMELLSVDIDTVKKIIGSDSNMKKEPKAVKKLILPIDCLKNNISYKNINIYYHERKNDLAKKQDSKNSYTAVKNTENTKNTDNNTEKINKPLVLPEGLSDKAKIIVDALKGGRLSIDDICTKTGLSIIDVHSCITELEIYSIIRSSAGRLYELI